MLSIHKFVTEDDINYYKTQTDKEIKDLIFIKDNFKDSKLIKDIPLYKNKLDIRALYGLPEGDIDILLKEFREENFTSYIRKGEWKHDFIKILRSDGVICDYRTRIASFRYLNKWNQKSYSSKYMLIIDSDNKILWLGGVEENTYFISVDRIIYSFKYEHKHFYFYPSITSNDEYFIDDNDVHNDNIINKYHKNSGIYRSSTFCEVVTIFKNEKIGLIILIDEYFKKGFFYKGVKWNKYYEYMYSGGMTRLNSIQVNNGLFHIEIENITYPYYGILIFDLNNFKVIETNVIKSNFE